MNHFAASRLKIERAIKHIRDIDSLVSAFTAGDDFHSVTVEYDSRQRTNHLCVKINTARFPADDIALTIGDVLHNLRSSLDLLWYQVVMACGGKPTKWTRFPVRDTRQELIAPLKSALEQKQVTLRIHNFVLNDVKPYMAGNPLIWALDDLNIRDKHQLLIPVLQMMALLDLRLENDKGLALYEGQAWFMDSSGRMRLREADDMRLIVKDKGHLTAAIIFDIGVLFESETVIPTLKRITEEVTRTIEAFQLLFPKGSSAGAV